MKSGDQRIFHIRNEDKGVIAKIVVLNEFGRYIGIIFIDSKPTSIETEVFNYEEDLNRIIRTLIFKASLSDFMDINEVDANGKKIK